MKHLLSFCLLATAWAQEAPTKCLKLDFVLKELDDTRVVSAKTYSGFGNTDPKSRGTSIRMNNKVPYSVGANNFQFADVGVNIDVQQIREENGQLLVMVIAEVHTMAAAPEASSPMAPTLRTNRWNATATIPIGKATTLFSSDDLHSRRKMQLELTATPVK